MFDPSSCLTAVPHPATLPPDEPVPLSHLAAFLRDQAQVEAGTLAEVALENAAAVMADVAVELDELVAGGAGELRPLRDRLRAAVVEARHGR